MAQYEGNGKQTLEQSMFYAGRQRLGIQTLGVKSTVIDKQALRGNDPVTPL